jgi:hypothetical protein
MKTNACYLLLIWTYLSRYNYRFILNQITYQRTAVYQKPLNYIGFN